MSRREKLDHIVTYYKWPILLGLIALIVLGSFAHRRLTEKEPVLYLCFANVAVGEELEGSLTDGFLRSAGANGRKQEVYLYRDLYLSDNADELNHAYAYASRLKLMGAVSAGRLDLVLMNREAYDLLSRGGYLLELSPASLADDPSLYAKLLPFLSSNAVILSDNGIAYQLGEAEAHEVEAETVTNALDVSDLPLFARAGFPDAVYLGVIANSARRPACLLYLDYLLSDA